MQLKIRDLLDEAHFYDQVRELRWSTGRQCPFCEGREVIRRGFDEVHTSRQRYECKNCGRRFDDLTGTVFSGHHQQLKVWLLVL
jgi:transposase-like protein